MSATRVQYSAAAPDRDRPGDAELLAAFGQELAVERDLPATLNAALEGMVRDLGAEFAEVFLRRGDLGGFVFETSRARSGPRRRQTDPNDPLLARCLVDSTVVCSAADGPAGPSAYAPLLPHGEPYGVVRLTRARGRTGFDARDRALLCAMAHATALTVANAQLRAAVNDQRDTARDLEIAAEIQRHLLPSVAPGAYPVFGLNRPIRQVSGDFFDFFALPDGRIAFALGDVAGKGINAALLMAKAASLYRCLGKTVFHPGELLERLNREIYETASRGLFVTMVAGAYDPSDGSLEFANAGHEPPLLRTQEHRYESYPADAPPLGILPEIAPSAFRIQLTGGEFYIFSDGLTEFRYGHGEQLGVKGLIQMIEALSSLPLAARLEALLGELYQEGWSLRDDLTVLAIDDSWVEPMTETAFAAAGGVERRDILLELRFPSRVDRIKLIRPGIEAAAAVCGLEAAVGRDVVLAVDEACQNIIVHGYKGRDDGEIILSLVYSDEGLLVELRDRAPPIDPAKIQHRALHDLRPGKLGSYFMSAIMDRIEYLPGPDGGNLIRMFKRKDSSS